MTTMAELIAHQETKSQANHLVHAARYLLMGKGKIENALMEAERHRALPSIRNYLEKAATIAGSTQTGNWGAQLAESSVSAFVESLKNFGAFDAALPFMKVVPIRTRVLVITTGATGRTVSEGDVKSISTLQLSGTNLAETKVSCIVVASDELVRNGGAITSNLIGTELRRALAVQTDSAFISKISSGISVTASSGNTADKSGPISRPPWTRSRSRQTASFLFSPHPPWHARLRPKHHRSARLHFRISR
jgi:HK97 family phage major capsid protein